MLFYLYLSENDYIFALDDKTTMKIYTRLSDLQMDDKDRSNMAVCPVCGQKLTQVRSVAYRAEFRQMCRRCKQFIEVVVEKD